MPTQKCDAMSRNGPISRLLEEFNKRFAKDFALLLCKFPARRAYQSRLLIAFGGFGSAALYRSSVEWARRVIYFIDGKVFPKYTAIMTRRGFVVHVASNADRFPAMCR